MFSRLLVPLDGSPLAEAALPVAERLAKALDATLVLLHVVERKAPATVHGHRHLTEQSGAQAYLEETAAALRHRGVKVEVHVHDVPEPDVAQSIASHGDDERADLIVLCTHGFGGVRDFVFGSIAQQVLQRGTTPVLLVRVPRRGEPAREFAPRTILVALDATADAEAALAPAAALAKALGAKLRLAMVVATQATMRGDRAPAAMLMPSAARAILDAEEERADAYLEGLAQPIEAAGARVETEVRRGDAASELASGAAAEDVGLIVAATHGRAGLQAIWAGSTVARLLKRTTAPILLLRTVDS
ncbi:MAG TPA: universal stress protein [Chloroflexota bacterium]|nr:universal stress protein [Chloroflexota bacterium]